MARNYSNKKRTRKAVIAMLCALSVTCTGLAAACAPEEEEKPSTAVTAKEDTQLLKNGNFEHFDIPDKAIHLIKNVNSWTLGGDTSVKSGVIGTSKDDWDKLSDPSLAETLDYNNDLSSDHDDYVNYNSMRSRDVLYKDTYAATLADDKVDGSWITKHDGGYQGYFGITGTGTETDPYEWDGKPGDDKTVYYNADDKEFYLDEGFTQLIRKEQITNPGTHWGEFKANEDGTYAFGEEKAYKDDNGNYYLDEDMEEKPVGNVLMIHNSPTDTNDNGLHQYYTSSSITLEAQTSAEISLWVKTSDLRFDKGYAADGDETDKGAYIEVVQTVASTTLDSFQIKAINTEKILAGAETSGKNTTASNGWIQYTIYVNACDFASTTVQLKLGLGNSENNEKVTGYAFFDDVQVTKYRDLSKDTNYNEAKVENTTCTLTSEEEKKIFYADATATDNRQAYDFHYLIDLASEKGVAAGNKYEAIAFDSNSVEVGLTTEKDSKDVEYAAATSIGSGVISDLGSKTQNGLKLPKDFKARPTSNDVITAFDKTKTFDGNYAYLLNDLTGEKGAHNLPAAEGGNSLVMFSAWGAPYTATVTDGKFTVEKDEYLLVSFWVKTSDMDGDTAATAKIYELNDKELVDEKSVQSLTIDTTDKTTNFEDEKDIYKGWVQCFFFVKNETDSNKTFKIDYSFGTTSIISATNFESGYAAVANLQTLSINEEIYELASANDNTALFSFTKDSDKDGGTAFDEATGNYDVNEGVAVPDNYNGYNGANVLGSLNDGKLTAGLINRDTFNDKDSAMSDADKDVILKGFVNTATSWNDVFGKNCYQPLIIVNSLRQYVSKANANESNFKDYYIKNDNGSYTKVAEDAEYDETETYYSLKDVANYGFVGESKTIAANGREVIGVRVKVTGEAVAYVYLVDTSDATDLKVMNFTTPAYTFWYDEEGNVLDEELDEDWTTAQHREHIVYTLREDGLYDGEDGKLYANLHNLVKSYKDSKYEHNEFFTRHENNGTVSFEAISYDEIKDGETYYTKDHKIADHYLCATDGTNVYEFIDGQYYYVETTKADGNTTEVTNKNNQINNFDLEYARYTNPDIDERLCVKLTAADCDPANGLADADGWVTVNFVIATGSEAKNYRLELWSGERDKTGVDDYKDGAVAFDYSHAPVDEKRLSYYEAEIVNAYNKAIQAVDPDLLNKLTTGTKENIRTYEELMKTLTEPQRKAIKTELAKWTDGNYAASYYTYTLYDSEAYVPFNANTANDGETGYNYDASSFTEQLAYLEFTDQSRNEKNVFVDYTAVDQSITRNTVTDDDDNGDEEETTNATELGLYISSIVLVVVLLITLVSILVTQYVKKKRKVSKKASEKNVYRKRDRYVKKLHLVKDEVVEPENGESEAPAEESTEPASEETVEEKSDDGESKE